MADRPWAGAALRQLAAVRQAVGSGALGGELRFLARRSSALAPGTAPQDGVIDALAADSLSLLAAIFGELSLEECFHDGRGGPEAEALLRLRSSNATGDLVLSRLRTLGERIDIVGERGKLHIDVRRGTVQAAPPELLRGGASEEVVQEAAPAFASSGMLHEAARMLRHPWEPEGGRSFDELAGKRVLVTGSTGFIGARVVERLAENGAEVTAGLRDPAKSARIARLGVSLARMQAGSDLRQLVRGHDAVVNLAHDFHATPARNEAVSFALADACEAERVPLLVQASSIAVYDEWPGASINEESSCDSPGHGYKQLKRAIEHDLTARQDGGRLRSVILQPTIVYGAFSRLWTDRFAEHFQIGDVTLPAEGLCEGVHVDDMADAILAAIARPGGSGRYIVSGPSPFPWREMLATFPAACPRWGALKVEETPAVPSPAAEAGRPPLPGALTQLRARVSAIAGGIARHRLGEQRLAELRARLLKIAARGRRPVYRPALESPRLFANQAAVSTARMRRDLVEPAIGIERGAELVRAYLRWRYCPFDDWPERER